MLVRHQDLSVVNLQNGHECFLGHIDVSDALHALLAFFLLFKKLALAADVATVALGQNILALRLDGFAGKDSTTNGSLDGHLEHLSRNDVFELLREDFSALVCLVLVNDEGKGVDGFTGKQDIELHQLRRFVAVEFVIERSIAAGAGLQFVEVVHDEFAKGDLPDHFDRVLRQVVHGNERAATRNGQVHDGTDVIGRNKDLGLEIRLLDVIDLGWIGHFLRRVKGDHLLVRFEDVILDRGCRAQQVKAEFALEALFDDLHVQKAQESDSESESECVRSFGFPDQGRIVEGQLFEGVFQLLVLIGIDRIQTGKNHWLDVAIAGQGFICWLGFQGDGVAHLDFGNILQTSDDIADIAVVQAVERLFLRRASANFLDKGVGARCHHDDLIALANAAIDDAHEGDDTAIWVEIGVEDKGPERCVSVALGSRNVVHDGFKKVVNTHPRFRRAENCVFSWDGQTVFDFRFDALRFGGGKIDFVDERDDLEVSVHRHHGISNGLSLDALRSIDYQDGAVACGKRAAYLVREVDVTRCVDEVELIRFAIIGGIHDANGLAFDGDSAFAFDVHTIQKLCAHVSFGHSAGLFEDTIRERGFAMIDVRNDRKVPDPRRIVLRYGVLLAHSVIFHYVTYMVYSVCSVMQCRNQCDYRHGSSVFCAIRIILPSQVAFMLVLYVKIYRFSFGNKILQRRIRVANIKSQKKRIITNEKSRMRNRAVKSELKTGIRRVREAVAAGNAEEAYASALAACRLLDKAASKGVIHKNQAANRKSGVMKLANTIVTDEVRAAYVKPETKKQEATGSKKAAAKAARKEAYAAAAVEKQKRVKEQQKAEKAAAEKKAAAAAAEAEAATEEAAE